MALALVLLIGAALLIRTLIALRSVDPGFDPHGILTMRMSLKDARFANTPSVEQLVRQGVQRIDAVPGVQAASASLCVPVQGYLTLRFTIPTVVNGRVYVEAKGEVDVYGLLPNR